MSKLEDNSSPPWALRVPNFQKPRSLSDTSVFDVKKLPVSKSSPEFGRQLSESATPQLRKIQENIGLSVECRTASTLPARNDRSFTQLRPKSHNGSERAVDFLLKLRWPEMWERSFVRSPRFHRKSKSKPVDTVTYPSYTSLLTDDNRILNTTKESRSEIFVFVDFI